MWGNFASAIVAFLPEVGKYSQSLPTLVIVLKVELKEVKDPIVV